MSAATITKLETMIETLEATAASLRETRFGTTGETRETLNEEIETLEARIAFRREQLRVGRRSVAA